MAGSDTKLRQFVISQQRALEAVKAQKHSQAAAASAQRTLTAKVSAVHTGSPETYTVRVVIGPGRVETNYLLRNVMSTDPDVTYSVGDYVVVLRNSIAPHYILSGGAGGSAGTGSDIILPTGWPVAGS